MTVSAPAILVLLLAAAAGCANPRGSAHSVPKHSPQSAARAPTSVPADNGSLAATVPDAPPGAFFTSRDEALLERYDGRFVPTGEGPLVRLTPVDSVYFGTRVLNDEEFAAVFPAIQRMDPYLLPLRGHRLSDRIIDLLNRLGSPRMLDLSDTNVSYEGLRKLRLKTLKTLVVPETVTEAQRRELEASFPGVRVR